jgi:hypothetical protein
MSEQEELTALMGGPHKTIRIGGQTHTISPLRVAELPSFIAAIQPMLASGIESDIQAALLKYPSQTLDAIAIAGRMDRADVDRLGLDDLIVLGAACIEVNVDFFTQTLAPLIETLGDQLSGSLTGSTSPPGSSPTATGTPM